jgi:hypothetical protein
MIIRAIRGKKGILKNFRLNLQKNINNFPVLCVKYVRVKYMEIRKTEKTYIFSELFFIVRIL